MKEKKKILFMIGANELAEHKSIFIRAVKERLDLFCANADRLEVDLCLYPSDRDQWRKIDAGSAEKLFELLEEAKTKGICIKEIAPKDGENEAENYDAYYGSPSFMPLHFTQCNKPAMIADMSIGI
ncbi:MAG: hypothetical protein K5686_01515 [Lachnospiraceae bacterium]|nr:hypothetical protein [Lachnospiraceae bacterium]